MVFATVIEPIMLFIILCGHCEHPYLLFFTQRDRLHFPTICSVPNLHAQHFPQRPFQTHLGGKKVEKKQSGEVDSAPDYFPSAPRPMD